jgi:tetratricopeptide (TPR) repeat protein
VDLDVQRDGRPRRPATRRWVGVVALLGLAIGVVAVVGLAGKLRRDAAVRKDAEQARRLIGEARYQEAQAPLQRWLAAEPRSAEALFLVAKGAIGLGMNEQGFAALDRAKALGHDADEVDRVRAIALAHLGQHEQAEPTLRRLVGSRPPDPELDQALARCHLETFQLRAAADSIERWIRHAPDDPQAYLWKAQLDQRINAPPETLADDFRQVLRLDPDNAEAHLGLGELLARQNQFEAAQGHFAAALRQRPQDGAANLGMGRALAGLGRDGAAEEHLQRATELMPRDAQPWIELARLALRGGRLDEALGHLDRAVAIDPFEPEAHYQRSLALSRLGRADEARAETERTNQLRKEHEELADLLVTLYSRPADVELQFQAARWMFQHGRPEEARRWAEKILREQPGHPATHRLLADYFEAQGQTGLANFHRLNAGPGPGRPE